MKNNLYILIIFLCIQTIYAQGTPFNASGHCMVNANNELGNGYQLEKRATFKYVGSNRLECTGTLINQATHNGENPRQLFYTSWHCLRTADFNFYQTLNYF